MKKVGLALSGGSSYGFAHIGVIKVLLQNNIPIDVISGTSMGALIGGCFAAGLSVEEMEKILTKFTRKYFVDVNPFFYADSGLLYGKKVTKYLQGLIGNKNIEDCNIKYCAIASDLVSGNKYVFTKGEVVNAIRASISIPGIFRPVKIDKMCLVDGGASDNLPVEDARALGAEMVIGVDVCSFYKKQNNLKSPLDILVSASNLLVSNLVQAQQDKGDVYIHIAQPTVKFNNYSPEESMKSIKIGEEYAKKFLPEIRKALGIPQPDKKQKKPATEEPKN